MKRLVLGLIFSLTLLGGRALAVEEPPFKTELHEGAFEIRDYPSVTVAEVTVSGEQRQAAYKGFRMLAGYIFGGNTRKQSIAMTAPVAQAPTGEKIAMTAPVSQIQTSGAWVVRFTMPRSWSLDTLPKPDDPQVHLRSLPPARYAVLRFSGLAWPNDVKARTAELDGLLKAHHLQPAGPVTLAQYNPPWTPWFMRRNEVMIPIAP